MILREELIDFVRRERRSYLHPDAPSDVTTTLGLDDDALTRWSTSEGVVATLPHASPNVFFPRTRVGWFAGRLQAREPQTHHVRLCLTHVNFSDLGWRPYGWWHLDGNGDVTESRLFSRNKKRKHVVVESRGPLIEPPDTVVGVDQAAAASATFGANLAVSSMIIGATVEAAAGMTDIGRTTYLPLGVLVRFVRHHAQRPGAPDTVSHWARAVLSGADGRAIGPDGQLHACHADEADVLDHTSNMALLALLDGPRVLGGAKMLGYWNAVDEVNSRLRRVSRGVVTPAAPVEVPDIDLLRIVRPSERIRSQLEQSGVPYSQGLAVREHGRFATCDPWSSDDE